MPREGHDPELSKGASRQNGTTPGPISSATTTPCSSWAQPGLLTPSPPPCSLSPISALPGPFPPCSLTWKLPTIVSPAAQIQPAASPRVLRSDGPTCSRTWAYLSSPTRITVGWRQHLSAPMQTLMPAGPDARLPPSPPQWAPHRLAPHRAHSQPGATLTHEGAQAADEAEEAALRRQGATLAAGTKQGSPQQRHQAARSSWDLLKDDPEPPPSPLQAPAALT